MFGLGKFFGKNDKDKSNDDFELQDDSTFNNSDGSRNDTSRKSRSNGTMNQSERSNTSRNDTSRKSRSNDTRNDPMNQSERSNTSRNDTSRKNRSNDSKNQSEKSNSSRANKSKKNRSNDTKLESVNTPETSSSRADRSAVDRRNDSRLQSASHDIRFQSVDDDTEYRSPNQSRANRSTSRRQSVNQSRTDRCDDDEGYEAFNRPDIASSSHIDNSRMDRSSRIRDQSSTKPEMVDFTSMFPEVDTSDQQPSRILIGHVKKKVKQASMAVKEASRVNGSSRVKESKKAREIVGDDPLRCYCGGRPESSKCRINMLEDKEQCLNCSCPFERKK